MFENYRKKRAIEEDQEARFYGNTLLYECGLARQFYSPEMDITYDQRNITCNWNKTWTPANAIDYCVWVACINPPRPPRESHLISLWDGDPVNFTASVGYECVSDDVPRYFENDKNQLTYNVSCLESGNWAVPMTWPRCLDSIECGEPPSRPNSGTWEWNNDYSYKTKVEYTCGPFGVFEFDNGTVAETFTSHCAWNKSFVPDKLPPCKATFCPSIPMPPAYTNLNFVPDPENSFTLTSPFALYGPRVPFDMKFPGPSFCTEEEGSKMLIVAKLINKRKSGHIVFLTDEGDEAIHIELSISSDAIFRSIKINNTILDHQGEASDGTTLDLNEPFQMTIKCDEDGWIVQENLGVSSYPHLLHKVPVDKITTLAFYGGLELSFSGFGNSSLTPAPEVGFNLTFACPTGFMNFTSRIVLMLLLAI